MHNDMIARLTGKVLEKSPNNNIVVEVGGVGYELVVPGQFAAELQEGRSATFFVAEHIKEDQYTLIGFANEQARAMYYKLTSVNGVGPKAALAILSTHDVTEIQSAILEDQIGVFSSVSGIGRKTAQRIILELKGKLVASSEQEMSSKDQAYQALLSLGYSAKDAQSALKGIDTSLSTQERIKQALKGTGI
jgi:Holliday junction DNA helicase RuvA